MNKNYTILIPTINRVNFLKRILNYYNNFEEDFKIIIGDSSTKENKLINKKNMLAFSNLDILYLDHYSSKINSHHKFADMVNYVDREYCVFCADDDFIIPNGINQSVTFLEKNSDFSVAQGRYIGFSVKNNDKKGTKQFYWISRYTNESIIFSDPKDRMYEHLSNYTLPTVFAVHRTELLKMVYKELLNSKVDPMQFGEFLPSILDLIYGKKKSLDMLYGVRQLNSKVADWPSLLECMKAGKYDEEYIKFKNCLAKHLTKKSQLSIDESKKVIDEAMSKYLKKYYFKSFKHILISKMKNLLNALDLPESIDKNLRMLYRKIFTPKYNLNKSKEYYNYKKIVESSNSKYFDDFERIRKHVLLYAKNNNKNIKDTICN